MLCLRTAPASHSTALPVLQVEIMPAARSPPCLSATSPAALAASPPPPSPPKGSSSPPAYPQRGQPAQTPQQTLPTIPEVHEEQDHRTLPRGAARLLARSGSKRLPSSSSCPLLEESGRRDSDEELAAASDGEPHATSADGGGRTTAGHRRRRLGTAAERRWAASGPAAALAGPTAPQLLAAVLDGERPGSQALSADSGGADPWTAALCFSVSGGLAGLAQQQGQQQLEHALEGADEHWSFGGQPGPARLPLPDKLHPGRSAGEHCARCMLPWPGLLLRTGRCWDSGLIAPLFCTFLADTAMDSAEDDHQMRAARARRPRRASGDGVAPSPCTPHPPPASTPAPSLPRQLASAAVAAMLLPAVCAVAAAGDVPSGCDSMED